MDKFLRARLECRVRIEPLELSGLKTSDQRSVFDASLAAFEAGEIDSARAGFVSLERFDTAAAAYLRRIALLDEAEPRIDLSYWDLTDK